MTGSTPTSNHERTTAVCVGGPLAGQRRTILYCEHFRVVECWPFERDERTVVAYVKQRFTLGNDDGSPIIAFWVPEGQTHEQTLELLFRAYEERHA